MPHPAMSPNNVAVITGGASGLGFAAAMRADPQTKPGRGRIMA